MAERWPGETQLRDNVDTALRQYFEGFKRYIQANPDSDIAEEWEHNEDIAVGWIAFVQTLGSDEGDDVDGVLGVNSDGMSRFTALGILHDVIDEGAHLL